MANYWLHYVGGVNKEDLSADCFGEFCRRIEERPVHLASASWRMVPAAT